MLRLAARVAAETTARAGVRYSGNVRTDGVRILYYVDVRAMTETATREREVASCVPSPTTYAPTAAAETSTLCDTHYPSSGRSIN